MKRIYFLADLHFDANNQALCASIFQALEQIKADQYKSALYLLGDVFESWLGFDDDETLWHRLQDLQIPIYFQHGNRDFLINKALLSRYQIELLPERYILKLGDKRVLLEHGDLLCVDDVAYQRLRKIVRHSWIQWLYHHLPKSLKQKIARKLRGQSSSIKQWVDVNEAEVQKQFMQHQADILIHGHTHRPAVHEYPNTKRFVLGDFRANHQGDYAGLALVYDDERQEFNLIAIPKR